MTRTWKNRPIPSPNPVYIPSVLNIGVVYIQDCCTLWSFTHYIICQSSHSTVCFRETECAVCALSGQRNYCQRDNEEKARKLCSCTPGVNLLPSQSRHLHTSNVPIPKPHTSQKRMKSDQSPAQTAATVQRWTLLGNTPVALDEETDAVAVAAITSIHALGRFS